MDTLKIGCLLQGNFLAKLPCYPHEQRNKPNIQHAPIRSVPLNKEEIKVWFVICFPEILLTGS